MTLTTQFYTMLAMSGMGLWLGASLDTYRLFVIRARTARWLLFIHDILFWILQGLLFFYVLLHVNEENSGCTFFGGSAGRCDVSKPLQTNLYKNTEIRHLSCCFCLSILKKAHSARVISSYCVDMRSHHLAGHVSFSENIPPDRFSHVMSL